MVSRIVFLVYWPVTAWEANRWGFDFLRSQGFTVEVYDLSVVINRRALHRCPVENELNEKWIYRFDSFASFAAAVHNVADCSMFIDYIMGLAPVDLRTEKVFRVLGRNRARYSVISASALPLISAPDTPGIFLQRLFHDIILATNPFRLINFFAKKLIYFLTAYTHLYPTPDLIFGGASEVLDRYCNRYMIQQKKIIPIHSIDYDIYLNFYRQLGPVLPDQTCVFLDEAATHHSDFELLNISPIEEHAYFRSMNTLFERIERETGLTVVIAAHPRSSYEKMADVFGGRRILKGQSVGLVARSSLVVTHASTAVSFAVLFNKPLILVKTDGIAANCHYSLSVDTMAHSLGLKPLLIDAGEFIQLPLDNFPLDGYRDYLYKYVKSPDVGAETVWEVVCRVLIGYEGHEPSDRQSSHA